VNDIRSTSAPSRTRHAVGFPLAISAIALVAIGLRPSIVSVGPILHSIIREFHLSHAGAALLTSIPDVLMGALSLPTPWLARRFGRDPVLVAALVLLCASTVMRAFAADTAGLLVWTAGVGAGIAVAGGLVAGFIKARFPGHAALAMALYATALSVGSAISAGVSGPVATSAPGGWRTASAMWSIPVAIGIVAWSTLSIIEQRNREVVPLAMKDRLPLGSRTAWRIAAFFACVNFLFYALVAWIAPIFHEGGISNTNAGLILAAFTIAFTIANPIFGWLSRSEDRRKWLAVAAMLTMSGLAAVAVAPKLAPLAFIPLCAFGLGGTFTLGMTLPLDNTRTVSEANAWNALMLTVGYLIAALGPLLVGKLRDLTGNYGWSLWLLVGVAGLMLILTPLLKPTRDG
jgi:MFS transporter, CP family, cyanate transporter